MIEILRPSVLLLLPLPLIAWWLLPPRLPPSTVPVPDGVRELLLRLTPTSESARRRWPAGLVLRIVGWLALIVALAGPHTRGTELQRPNGRDLFVAIDLSSSMEESDMLLDGVNVPRYQVVKQRMREFIEGRQGDRVGLIAFGHEAFLITPLSFDVDAVAATLDDLTIGLPGHRTDLGRAVGLAVQSVRDQPKATRVLMLLSDGEDNSGALTGLAAAEMAAMHDMKIHTIGFTSALDEDGADILRSMAELSGGQFFAAESATALNGVARSVAAIEPSASDAEPRYIIHDWSGVALIVGLLALSGLALQGAREL